MRELVRKAASAVGWRWKYRFRPTRYRAFIDLCEGREVDPTGWFPEQRAIAQEAMRLRRAFASSLCDSAVTDISVVIPHFNQQRFLGEAIDSALAQTTPATEIIVVDDCSDDRSAVRAVEMSYSREPRVRFDYPSEKLYAGGAKQRGVELASASAVSFLDADDIMHPQRIELVKAVMESRSDCAFVITGAIQFEDNRPEPAHYDRGRLRSRIIPPSTLTRIQARRFSVMRLSWLDPETQQVPWYAWGSFGINGEYQPCDGPCTVRRGIASLARWPSPREYVFTPYEDYEYCMLLHAATGGGYQIDLPLLSYRKGSTTNDPARFAQVSSWN